MCQVSCEAATRRLSHYVHWVTRALYQAEQSYFATEARYFALVRGPAHSTARQQRLSVAPRPLPTAAAAA
jgi:hypothetical protein